MATALRLIANGAASDAYLDVERTLERARALLAPARPITVAAYRALEARLRAHAEQLRADHAREVAGGLLWSSDTARLTYRLLQTYRNQVENRIRVLVTTAAAAGVRP